jgi:hypothetical protein
MNFLTADGEELTRTNRMNELTDDWINGLLDWWGDEWDRATIQPSNNP